MIRRRWAWISASAILILVIIAVLVLFPELIRRFAVARIEAATGREATIADVDWNPFTGRLAVNAFQLASREEPEPFVQFERFSARVHILSLLAGRLRLSDAVLLAPTVRIVRRGPTEFNFSDLLRTAESGRPQKAEFAITIKHFRLHGGMLHVTDRTTASPHTWTIEHLFVEANNISTESVHSTDISARFTLAGALVSIDVTHPSPAPLRAHIAAAIQDLDLAEVLPYVPSDKPVMIRSGRLDARLAMGYERGGRFEADGELRCERLIVASRPHDEPFITVPALTVAVRRMVRTNEGVAVERLEVAGEPTIVDAEVSPPVRVNLKTLHGIVEEATWPAKQPIRVELVAGLPEEGRLEAEGTLDPRSLIADLHVSLQRASLAPYWPYLSLAEPLTGTADADLNLVGSIDKTLKIKIRGRAGVNGLKLGPKETPIVLVERAEAAGLEIDWPRRLGVEQVVVYKPSVRIERVEPGAFPLRTMFMRPAAPVERPHPAMAKEIDHLVIEDGVIRFIDRTTSPNYRETLSQVSATVEDLSTAPGRRGKLTGRGVLSGGGTIEVRGQSELLGGRFFLDLDGAVRRLAVPTTNPYLERLLAWSARKGELTTTVHYRIEGDRLHAVNEIMIDELDLVRTGERDIVQERVGLPLGLLVGLMKNVHGEIRLTVPVSGRLASPEFSFWGVFWTSLRNAVINVVTAPFRLIGRLFEKEGRVEEIEVNPLQFEHGTTTLSRQGEQQIQHLAEFLREFPYVRLVMTPVVSEADLKSLKTRQVIGRIQQVKREQRLPDLSAAARRLFKQRFPNRPVPAALGETLASLVDVESVPEREAKRLAAKRVDAVRDWLGETAGVAPDRLHPVQEPKIVGDHEEGRVEFVLASSATEEIVAGAGE